MDTKSATCKVCKNFAGSVLVKVPTSYKAEKTVLRAKGYHGVSLLGILLFSEQMT